MNDQFKSKKTVVKNYNTTNNNGDTYIIIGTAGFLSLVLVSFIAYVVYLGVTSLIDWMEFVIVGLSEKIQNIHGVVSDPVVKPYFIAISILLVIVAFGIWYLIKRFKIDNIIAKFFEDEEDVDFL